MQTTQSNTLRVPGATLYHEVRGSGPVLLLICGGVYDAAGYAALADRLADRYTVVTYDRRGNSRSPLDGPPAPQRIEVHGDDATSMSRFSYVQAIDGQLPEVRLVGHYDDVLRREDGQWKFARRTITIDAGRPPYRD